MSIGCRSYRSHDVDNGDGTVTVYFVSPGNNNGHIRIGLDKVGGADMWRAIDVMAAVLDSRARDLATANARQTED